MKYISILLLLGGNAFAQAIYDANGTFQGINTVTPDQMQLNTMINTPRQAPVMKGW